MRVPLLTVLLFAVASATEPAPQPVTALRALALRAAKGAAKDGFEDIADVAKIGPAATARTTAILESGLAEPVIGGALLRIFQAVIGLVDRLEPRLCLLITRIAVGVILHGELAIGFFKLIRRCFFIYAQNLIKIFF